jgi:D-aspartate ligase
MLVEAIEPSLQSSLSPCAPPAVVLGGGRTALGMVRSLARAGIRPIVVSNKNDDVTIVSRYAQKFSVRSFDGEELIEDLLRLSGTLPQKGVLLFSDDRPLMTASHYRDQLKGAFHLQLPSHEMIVKLGQKLPFFEIAQQHGFPVPTTYLLRERNELTQINNLVPPLCIKPNGRSSAYDNTFKKAYRIDDCADAITLCKRILEVVPEVIVQEWIEGSNDSIYFSLCSLSASQPIAFTGRKGRSWPPQIGVTASCWAAPEVSVELESLTFRFYQEVGITTGLASMEFKRDQRDGRFLMVEPTVGRANLQQEISALCGVNICHVAYCDAAGLPRPQIHLDPAHVWRDEFRDHIAAWILGVECFYPSGYQIHNSYWRWDDPAPAMRTIAEYPRRIIHRLYSRASDL